VIQATNLVKRYGGFTAVDGVSLDIASGQIYGFLGPNGAGKTSTILMLLGILKPTSGRIRLFGEDYHPGRLDLRRRIGVVPEKQPLGAWGWMTALEYLSMFADLFRVHNARQRIGRLLERVGLTAVRNKRIAGFSHGMLQKLSIVRALLPDPDILFLDEPITGLDPFGVKQTRDLIQEENREGRTIFISSHILSEVEKICRRVAILHHGRLLVEDEMSGLVATLVKDREIHIELEAMPERLAEEVKALPFVKDASTKATTLVVRISKSGDYRKDVTQFLFARNLMPLAIQEKLPSLEDAFVTITQDNVDLFAGIRERR
jgi:ABC-type multidrug transport system ATPase subunit